MEDYINDLEKAKTALLKNGYSFVLIKNGEIIKKSFKRGVIPFMEMIRDNQGLMKGAVIADKVIGNAAALLAFDNQIKAIYAGVISERAKDLLLSHNIECNYNKCVPYIKNRDNSDKCPMEKLTNGIDDPKIAYKLILDFYLEQLKIDLRGNKK